MDASYGHRAAPGSGTVPGTITGPAGTLGQVHCDQAITAALVHRLTSHLSALALRTRPGGTRNPWSGRPD